MPTIDSTEKLFHHLWDHVNHNFLAGGQRGDRHLLGHGQRRRAERGQLELHDEHGGDARGKDLLKEARY